MLLLIGNSDGRTLTGSLKILMQFKIKEMYVCFPKNDYQNYNSVKSYVPFSKHRYLLQPLRQNIFYLLGKDASKPFRLTSFILPFIYSSFYIRQYIMFQVKVFYGPLLLLWLYYTYWHWSNIQPYLLLNYLLVYYTMKESTFNIAYLNIFWHFPFTFIYIYSLRQLWITHMLCIYMTKTASSYRIREEAFSRHQRTSVWVK